MRDEDDWVGTPPEGHITRDRADPEFWRAQTSRYAIGAGLLVTIVVVLLVIALVL